MTRLLVCTLLAALAAAGCGNENIEQQVRDQYGGYAEQHGFKPDTTNIDRIDCDKNATRDYDGWCRIHPKGFHLTYDVPYRDQKPLWGDSGLMKAPS